MAYRTDELRYKVYARHGDMCSLPEQHHDSLGCASRLKGSDYVLVAQFAYLTESIDYAQVIGERGVRSHLRSQRYGSKQFDVSEYPVRLNTAESIAVHVNSAS